MYLSRGYVTTLDELSLTSCKQTLHGTPFLRSLMISDILLAPRSRRQRFRTLHRPCFYLWVTVQGLVELLLADETVYTFSISTVPLSLNYVIEGSRASLAVQPLWDQLPREASHRLNGWKRTRLNHTLHLNVWKQFCALKNLLLE